MENITCQLDKSSKKGFIIQPTNGSTIVKSVKFAKGGALQPGGHTKFKFKATSEEEKWDWIRIINVHASETEQEGGK